jgi:hypothetical protein
MSFNRRDIGPLTRSRAAMARMSFQDIESFRRGRRAPLTGDPRQAPFPPPWTVEELDACFVVRDHNRQQLAYVYIYEDEPGRRSAAKLLSKDEARRVVVNAPGPLLVTMRKFKLYPLAEDQRKAAAHQLNGSVTSFEPGLFDPVTRGGRPFLPSLYRFKQRIGPFNLSGGCR